MEPPPPTRIVSRGKETAGYSSANFANAKVLVDGIYRTYATTWRGGSPTPDKPSWVAIHVGDGAQRLLLGWSDGGSYNYNETTYGSPADYRIEVSADSTDGENGTFKPVVQVTGNTFHARAHSFPFAGMQWVKVVFLKPPKESPNGLGIDEIDVYALSASQADSWFFMGDSVTAFAFDRGSDAHQPSFAELVEKNAGPERPHTVNGGIGGETSKDGVAHLDEWLKVNPDARYWGLLYGTNDSAGDAEDTSAYRDNMEKIVTSLIAAGKVPVLARIPFAPEGHENVGKFNAVVDDITKAHGLLPGPDLYAWFKAHPEELRDGLHPNDKGIVSMNRLWWEAVRCLYVPG